MRALLSTLLAERAPLPWLATRRWHPWLVIGLLCVGAFAGQLDATIVQLALPTLARTFDAPTQTVSWVALAYLLAFASFLPIFGRLSETIGRKSLYLLGFAVFVGASALCGLAETLPQLLAFRFLQGAGGAMLGANSIAILVAAVPPASRGRALGVFAAAQAVGMSAGPAIGGLILETLGWRWVFWIVAPFGLVAMILGWLALPLSPARAAREGFDWGGAVLIGPALILLVGTLNHAADWGLVSAATLGGLGGAAALFALLARRETRTPAPLVDPRLFRSAGFRFGALAVALAYALLYATFFVMSFALSHGYGESPAQAGLRLAIVPVAIGLCAPFSHDVERRVGAARLGMAAMLFSLAGLGVMTMAVGDPHHRLLDTFGFALMGVGLGLFIAPANAGALAAAPAERSGGAGAMLNLMRCLGTSLGVAAGASALTFGLPEGGGLGDSQALLAQVRGALPLLAVMAVAAAFASRAAARAADRRAAR